MFTRTRSTVFAASLLLIACVFSPAQVVDVQPPANPQKLIVKFRPGAGIVDRERALRNSAQSRDLGAGLQRQAARGAAHGSTMVLSLREGVSTGSELARLAGNPAVEFVEPNYPIKVFAPTGPVLPNDFEFSKMYALLNAGGPDSKTNADIHATEAWRYTTGDKRIVVAVIDTGIDYLHQDLRDNLWINPAEIPFNGMDDDANGLIDDYYGYDFVSNDSDPFDDNEHGTHVAGIIGARGNNGIGTTGVCWDVSLMALKAFDEQGNGTVESAIAAIEYAVRNGARIINASWGLDEKSRALEEAIQRASDAGALFIASAGNNRNDVPNYPASFESVLSVGATDRNDARAGFSSYGPTVDVAAPGDNVFSTLPENRYGYLSGTSMAAPHVSGVAALVLSRFPQYTRQELFDILINSVDVVPFDQLLGAGRLDASKAVQMDQPLPTARQSISGTISGAVAVSGTALGAYATGFAVFIGSGRNPTNWVQAASSTERITNGVLAHLDTGLVPDGPAVVQLVVTNQNGATAKASSPVRVLNALISDPLSADIVAPGKYEIRGTLYGPNKTFDLSYGEGLAPKTWTPLPSLDTPEVLEGKLGEWDATKLPTGPYTLRMVSSDGSHRAEFLAPLVYLDRRLRPGWPIRLETDEDFPLAEWRNIRIADLDGDGQSEIIVVEPGTRGRQQKLEIFSLDGNLIWQKELGFDIPPDVAAVGDVDGDGKMEIFVDLPDGVLALHHDGRPVPGWPIKTATRNHAKVLADLDRNGTLEVITFSQEYSATQVPDLRDLAVYGGNGALIRKWELPWCGFTNDVQKIFPAVANLDDDPELEIVAVSGCSEIAAFDYRRTEPKWRSTAESTFLSSPVIGDIDGDGHAEVIIAGAAENDAETGGVYVFDGNGQRWRGWPVLEEYSFMSAPALGDLDRDGRLEIVLASTEPSALHVLQWDGFEADGWPVDAFYKGTARVGIALADLDADGASEIITAAPGFTSLALSLNDPDYIGGIVARKLSGEVMPLNGTNLVSSIPFEGFPQSRTHKSGPPIFGDFDGDGMLDLAIASLLDRTYGSNLKVKNRSSVYSWQLEAPLKERTLEWPMFAHDAQNRGAYSFPALPHPQPTNEVLAVRDRVIGAEDLDLTIEPLVNDVGSPPLRIASISQPEHGTVSQQGDSKLLYRPDADYSGLDGFTYTMLDSRGASSVGKITVRIKPLNDGPVAEDIRLTMKKNSSVSIFYTAKDPENDGLSFRVVDSPNSGELWNYPSLGTYYPRRGFYGSDSFHYVASDGKRESPPALVWIDVINSNNPPTAVSETFLTKTNRPVRIQPSASDLDNDEIVFELVTSAQHGTVTLEDNVFQYVPEKDFLGTDSFTIRPFDGTAFGDLATLSVSVIATNAIPKAPDGSAVVPPNTPTVLNMPGFDPDGDEVSFVIIERPLHGNLFGDPPRVTYLPDTNYLGPDRFTYRVSDSLAQTGIATFTIQVVRLNRAPEAEDQTVSTGSGELISFDLAVNDPDNDEIQTVILKGPAKGLLYGRGKEYHYLPAPGSLGTDTFTYKAWDGEKFGNIGRVSVVLSVPREELPPTFIEIQHSTELVRLVLDVPNTNAFSIEVSTNLTEWSSLSGPLISPAQRFTFQDTNTAAGTRFYRARKEN